MGKINNQRNHIRSNGNTLRFFWNHKKSTAKHSEKKEQIIKLLLWLTYWTDHFKGILYIILEQDSLKVNLLQLKILSS